MVTDAELVFWCVCGVLAILFACVAPMICNYMEYERLNKK